MSASMNRLFAPAEEAAASSHADIPYSHRTVMSRRQFCATSIGGLLAMSSASSAMSAEGYLDPQVVRESYRKPNATESIVIEPRIQYPYSFSPWEYLGQQELEEFDEHPNRKAAIDTAMIVANNVANRTAEFFREHIYQEYRMLREDDWRPTTSGALAMASINEELLYAYVECLGEVLLEAGYGFQEQDLLSEAFNTTEHRGSRFTLDCDLLVYMALHTAFRHDMPLAAVPAPSHMYLGSMKHENWAAELTLIGKSSVKITHEGQKECAKKRRSESPPPRSEMKDAHDPQNYVPCDEAYIKEDMKLIFKQIKATMETASL